MENLEIHIDENGEIIVTNILGHKFVDLGLPSGLKWAAYNVGAQSPEEYGDYFAWGEVNPKSAYTEENCSTIDLFLYDFFRISSYIFSLFPNCILYLYKALEVIFQNLIVACQSHSVTME